MKHPSILWRRVDHPGHETARLICEGSSRHLNGTAVFLYEGQPCRLDYQIVCNAGWETTDVTVDGWVGDRDVNIEISVTPDRRWRLNGREIPGVAGAADIDLNFSPSTNLLPIRRLNLKVGEEAPVKAAWLRFPSFALEPFEQVYRRTAEDVYRYESAGGEFVRDLTVDAAGFARLYPGLWEAE